MLHFFRKIRHDLIANSQTFKYLKYAFGEVILVMLGILMALQVNNWNESKKTEHEELKYLQRLKMDLIQDTLYYNERIIQSRKSVENNSKAIKLAYQNQITIREFQDLLSLYDFNSEPLTIQDDTFREMTNSGKLNILKNEKMKVEIIRFYKFSSVSDKHIKEFNDYTAGLLVDFSSTIPCLKYYPYSNNLKLFYDEKMFNDSDWEWINDPTSHGFRLKENVMLVYIGKHLTFLSYFFDLKSESKLIIKLIDDELKSRY